MQYKHNYSTKHNIMIFNYSKAILLSLLALASTTSAISPGSLRRKLDKDQDEKGPILLKRKKGKDGDPDEIVLQLKVHKCEEDSNACEKLKEKGMEVTKRQLKRSLAKDLLAALDSDDDEMNNDAKGDDKKKHEKMLPLPICVPLYTCDSTDPYNCYEYDTQCSYY